MNFLSLAECCEIVSGATPKTSVAEYWDGDVEWATPADLSKLQGAFIEETPRKITNHGLASCAATVLPAGSVLLSSRAPIGHVAINTKPMATNQGFKSLIPRPDLLDAKYLFHWLRANKTHLQSLGNGATFKELSKATVARVRLPVPPLDEQRRIAAILDQADAVHAKGQQVLSHFEDLTQSILHDMFGALDCGATVGEIAEIQGGLQVSAKRTSLPIEVPYLRVANAHRGRLVLSEVKTLRATKAEVERTTLVDGDLLFVEGHASPNEVGRVAMWAGEVEGCVHQNHLIRGRLDHSRILPIFATTWLNSDAGARHFRRAGRTTSGLNTISAATVRSAPIPVPPMEQQRDYARCVGFVDGQRDAALRALRVNNELFASLQSRAFRGELK